MSGRPDGSGIGDHNASAFLRSRLPFVQINLIVWCVLIFSVVRGCDPTKEPPTPDIMPRFAVVLGQIVSASLTSFTAGRTHSLYQNCSDTRQWERYRSICFRSEKTRLRDLLIAATSEVIQG
jgi:hypothetical protein